MLLVWSKMAAGGPHHYGSETVWRGRNLGGERGAGPHGHFHYVPLSYCGGRERGKGEGEEGKGVTRGGRSATPYGGKGTKDEERRKMKNI